MQIFLLGYSVTLLWISCWQEQHHCFAQGWGGVCSEGGGGNDWGSELLDGQLKVSEKFKIRGIKCDYFELFCRSSAAFWAWSSIVKMSGSCFCGPLVKTEQWGWDLLNIRGLGQNLELMWDFWKWNQCLSFCRVCLIKQSNSLLNTAGFARQEYTNLAEIVFLSVISVQTKTFSVSNKQNIQSHLWLSSVVWIQSTLICLDLL